MVRNWEIKIDPRKYDAYIFDIDGTLAINDTGLEWFDPRRSLLDDALQQATYEMYKMCREQGNEIILLTSRSVSYKDSTIEWLRIHNIQYSRLFMRDKGNELPCEEYKKQVYYNKILPDYNVISVFEDKPEVVDMWREIGLTCFQLEYRH